MTEDVTICAACGGEQRQDVAVICGQCGGRLTARLRGVRELLRLLDDTISRQDRIERLPGRYADDQGHTLDARYAEVVAVTRAPFNESASDASRSLRGAVQRYADALVVQLGRRTHVPPPRLGDAARAAVWLADHVQGLRQQSWADAACGEIGAAVSHGWQLVDRPAEVWYAGHCDAEITTAAGIVLCGWELYAPLGAAKVLCRGCGTRHDVQARRETLLAAAGDVRVTAAIGARALTSEDHPVTPAAIRGWKHRGLLVERGVNAKGQPEYLLGDLLTVSNRVRYGLSTPKSA